VERSFTFSSSLLLGIMPLFYRINNHGQKERIFPLRPSDLRGFIICENEKAVQLNIHRGCIEVVNTEEEISEARRRYIEQNYGELLKTGVINPS
jgi:hypothetical protein